MNKKRRLEDDDTSADELNISSEDEGEEELDEESEDEESEDDGSEHDPDEEEEEESEDEEEESEDEDESEDESEEEEEEEGEDPDDPDLLDIANEGNSSIPLARVREMVEKARKEGAESAKASGEAVQVPEFDLKAKLAERNQLMLEGEVEKATEIDLQIEEHRTRVAAATAQARVEAANEATSLQKVVKRVQRDYQALSDAKGNKEYDPEAVQDVLRLRNSYIQEGMAPASALQKAADRYFGKKGVKPKGKSSEGETEEEGDDKKTRRLSLRQRMELQRQRQKRQPGATGKTGTPNGGSKMLDIDGLDPEELSDEELDSLTPAQLARLDGSIVKKKK